MDEALRRRVANWQSYLAEAGFTLYRARGAVGAHAEPGTEAATETPAPAPTEPSESATETLEAIRAELGDCTRCGLHEGRTHIVFGEGNPGARLMFVGEGPGFREDQTGRPFVGRAGELLDRMIAAMGLARGDTYIANIVKCRPPNNRDPHPNEVATCLPFLHRQIAAIQPEVIVTLGKPAARALLGFDAPMRSYRGVWHTAAGVDVMPTYHPAYLLRNPDGKRNAWSDLQAVMAQLGLERPG